MSDSDAGKGDDMRPLDRSKFDPNHERIFGTDEEIRARRQAFILQKKLGFTKPIKQQGKTSGK